MNFDAIVFWPNSPSRKLTVEQLHAEIVADLGEGAHAIEDGNVPSYIDRRTSGLDSIKDILNHSLRSWKCRAMPWFSGILVIAHAGLFTTFLHKIRKTYHEHVFRTFTNCTVDAPTFAMAQFADYDEEGCVCWQFARGADKSVLVMCEYPPALYWWRPASSKATPLRIRLIEKREGPIAQVIYRVDSLDVLRELWSHVSKNDNTAILCAPESAELDRVFSLGDSRDFASMLEFAEAQGWAYLHRYGGGADEHYACFASNDPALVERVYRHAEKRAAENRNWWHVGLY